MTPPEATLPPSAAIQPATADGAFAILTICTGNICRSPLAEVALRREVSAAGTGLFVLGSAGTRAEPGDLSPREALESARAVNLDLAGHRARELTAPLLAEADLILAASREHRRAAATLLPRATRKTFTLREFARLAVAFSDDDFARLASTSASPRARLVEATRLSAALRGTLPAPADPADLDVVDPYGRGAALYDESRAVTLDAVAPIAAFLRRVAAA